MKASKLTPLAGAVALCVILSNAKGGENKPAPDAGAVPWGISSSSSSFKNYEAWFPKMAEAGVRSVRLFPEWRGFEPAQGTWKWDRADAMVKCAADNDIQISGMLFGSAPWSKDGSHAFPMNHLDDWSNYVSKLVDHYKDQIHYWEVWNEGNAGFNDGHHTTADYAELVARAYAAAKNADPTAQVGMSVASFDAPYIDQAILAQAKIGKPDSFDYICIHPYETLGDLRESDGEIPFLWMTHMLRDALRADAPAKVNVPVWITEIGMPVGKNASESDAAKALLKSYTMAVAQGIARVMWFEARDPVGEEAGFGLLNRDGSPRLSYGGFKTMTHCLGATPKYQGWLALGAAGKGYGFVFEGASAPVLAAWMPAGASDNTVSFAGDVQVVDGLSGVRSTLKAGQQLTLTDMPVFVIGAPAALVAQARENAGKNFPWGGDFSSATAVGIQLGAAPVNNGIMQTGRKSNLPYQYPDGSSGIEIRKNAGFSFYAHPSFAGFKTSDYYIRLTLRRIGPGNVGMNINYEIADTKGQHGPTRHNGGWYSLPADAGWQTHTWHVTDACFAKMWGYDFSFQPEKSVPFVIGKVEVSTRPFGD
ncbi:MAG TPA: endo-1,4-beta-xylanase [Tepidisphaeraceae bacterium]|nr:endo-1,4-beta-xylanase [Tepidisphaeraceae bacterium]